MSNLIVEIMEVSGLVLIYFDKIRKINFLKNNNLQSDNYQLDLKKI